MKVKTFRLSDAILPLILSIALLMTLHYYDNRPLIGWQQLDGETYYFDPETGLLHTGWLELAEGKYYLDENGNPVIGLLPCLQGTYYFDEGGLMVTGWTSTADGKRYFAEDGTMAVGFLDLDGKRYCFSRDGIMYTGLHELQGRCFYFDESGAMATGWAGTADGKRYFADDGTMAVGFLDLDGKRYYLDRDGVMYTGWLELQGQRYYFDESGAMVTTPGWLRLDEGTWYLKEDGQPYTGWMHTDEARYYFTEDGSMAVGALWVDDVFRYFSSDGNYVPLVNPWTPVPEDYIPRLVYIEGHQIDSTCVEALSNLINDARDAGLVCELNSSYRDMGLQTYLWSQKYYEFIGRGCSAEEASRLTSRRIAYPGTSEHHTGLAIDIMELVEDGALYEWFRQHAWEYGFIVRYREDKEPFTGIMDEPWHLRYVGKELAQTLWENDWCLEEFFNQFTA